ncbi:hypothetical protein CYMTET_5334 [Cymbomonas tetramitiformis]|uniref:Uncharacterized protein n=1 Tax=Cymbomonas tetramitiformis TaxID=36881 RepID=A0AAE0CCY0_9CHLO|nr:hypothetical protein CYMTET_38636 [Cymbomonas tetramitiformis]KAK3253691.1 hypothetical protein CYMTET_37026 [Cymbomonas tetramitiformis]KAK3287152.1 hypothetical protein CYMTET_5334 [Cymbomonas tetramitiformis]
MKRGAPVERDVAGIKMPRGGSLPTWTQRRADEEQPFVTKCIRMFHQEKHQELWDRMGVTTDAGFRTTDFSKLEAYQELPKPKQDRICRFQFEARACVQRIFI